MKKQEILAKCLEEIRTGKSTVADCASRYPELATILNIAVSIKADDVNPSPEFKLRAKHYVFDNMQDIEPAFSSGFSLWPKHVSTRILASIAVVLVIFGAAGGSVVYAAQSSLPGDALYPVKTGVENLQVAVTPSPAAKANLHLIMVQRRINEIAQVIGRKQSVNSQTKEAIEQELDSAVNELNQSKDTQTVNKVLSRMVSNTLSQRLKLEQIEGNETQSNQQITHEIINEIQRGNNIAQVAYANSDFLKSRPSVIDTELDAGLFQVEGNLLSIQDGTWNIGGKILHGIHNYGKQPSVGNRVVLQGLVKGDQIYVSSIGVSGNTADPTTVEGDYEGTNQNGTANIGGLSIVVDNSTQLQSGERVQLQDSNGKGQFDVTESGSKPNQAETVTTLSGVLAEVDISSGTITVNASGNQITINVGESRIVNRNRVGQTISLAGLNRFLGNDVTITGLYESNNILFAREVRIGDARLENRGSTQFIPGNKAQIKNPRQQHS